MSAEEFEKRIEEGTEELANIDGELQTVMSEHEQAESFIRATNSLLKLYIKKSSRKEYLDSVVDLIRNWSGCRCVGIRVLDAYGNIPFESYVGYSHEFWESENWLSLNAHQCACTRVIQGKPQPQDLPAMTQGGSFRCDNTKKFFGALSEEKEEIFRGVCLQSGFTSLAVIPIRLKGAVIGAVHLADEKEGRVPLKVVEFIESISPLIGDAVHGFSTEEELIKYQNHLEELVEERTAMLKAATGKLQEEINERTKMQEALRKSHDELEIRVKERTVELEKVNMEMVNEIAERKRIVEALRKSEASLSEAQRIARLGNWDWDIQTNKLYWSDEIYRIFGLFPQQFGATYEAFLDSVHPDDREFVKKAVNEALFRNQPYIVDHRIVLPDGTVRVVHEQAEVKCDEASAPVRMIGTVQDITESKLAEEELRVSHEQLRKLSAHLQSVREEERTRIAREIHDELGQVLTALKMEVSMLTSKLFSDRNLLEKTESIMKKIDDSIQSVKRICAELRPAILDHFGLSAAIEWQMEEFKNLTGIKADVSLAPKEIILDQDLSTTVFRIFQEALTNVARHAKASEVKVGLKLKEGNIMLEVKDDGEGISRKQFSGPNSFGIIGIKERVNYFGGDVKITSVKDKGTTLMVSIPIRKMEVP